MPLTPAAPSAYRQYLAAFPDGPHVAAAETNIAALEAPPPPDTGGRTLSGDNCGPAGDYRVVDIPANDILSIRAAPDRNAAEIGVIPPDGGGIAVGGCRAVQGYKFPWCEVSYAVHRGWAYSRYLADSSGSQPGGGFAQHDAGACRPRDLSHRRHRKLGRPQHALRARHQLPDRRPDPAGRDRGQRLRLPRGPGLPHQMVQDLVAGL